MKDDLLENIEKSIQETKTEILESEERLEELLVQIEEQDNQENNI